MPKRIDRNQPEIVKALRKSGCSVLHLHIIGRGCPDILVGFRNKNYLFEIKDGDKPPSAQKLTPAEKKFFMMWDGQVNVIKAAEDALKIMGLC